MEAMLLSGDVGVQVCGVKEVVKEEKDRMLSRLLWCWKPRRVAFVVAESKGASVERARKGSRASNSNSVLAITCLNVAGHVYNDIRCAYLAKVGNHSSTQAFVYKGRLCAVAKCSCVESISEEYSKKSWSPHTL